MPLYSCITFKVTQRILRKAKYATPQILCIFGVGRSINFKIDNINFTILKPFRYDAYKSKNLGHVTN